MNDSHAPHRRYTGSGRRPTISRPAVRQIASFAAIGVASTAAYVGLYAALRNVSTAAVANVVALVVTAIGNTAANRRLTFDVRGREGMARHHLAGLVALAAALVLTSASLAGLDVVAPHRGRLTEIAVLVVANAAATLVRFLLLRLAIDRAPVARAPASAARARTTVARTTVARTSGGSAPLARTSGGSAPLARTTVARTSGASAPAARASAAAARSERGQSHQFATLTSSERTRG